MNERIQQLLAATQPYCPGQFRSLSIRNDSGKVFGHFYLDDAAKREQLELVLSGFEDILDGSNIYEIPSYDVVGEALVLARFDDIERLAIDDLGPIIKDVAARQGNDEVYSISIWLDPEQGGWSYLVRCERAYQATLEGKRAGPFSKHYQSGRDTQRFRFYDYATYQYDPSTSLRELLGEIGERQYDNYVRYGDQYTVQAGAHLFEFMTDTAACVLRAWQAMAVEHLRTTNGLLAYVQYYDQDERTEFRAARRTVPGYEIRAAMGELYGNLARA